MARTGQGWRSREAVSGAPGIGNQGAASGTLGAQGSEDGAGGGNGAARRTAGAGSCGGDGAVVNVGGLRVTALVGQLARQEERQETARLLGRDHRSTAAGSAGESTNVAIGIVVGDTVRHDNGSTAMADVFGTAPVADCPGGPV